MSEEEEALAVVRKAAPCARRAARASWIAAFAWTWLACRLTARVWIWGVAESLGLAIALLLYGLIGFSVVCVAALRGFGGLALDGWRWLWRRA